MNDRFTMRAGDIRELENACPACGCSPCGRIDPAADDLDCRCTRACYPERPTIADPGQRWDWLSNTDAL
jgi:hypothetical protein